MFAVQSDADVLVLAHRGLWRDRSQRNTPAALEAALRAGFGVETDVRDCRGELVISHDMPTGAEQRLDEFLDLYVATGSSAPLAINVKADGLAAAIKAAFAARGIDAYFCFDMSVPDARCYDALDMPFFARLSEWEPRSPLAERAAGIWLDAFDDTWFDAGAVRQWLDRGRDVCIVSPELHGRPHEGVWAIVHECLATRDGAGGRLLLCTDLPERFAGVNR